MINSRNFEDKLLPPVEILKGFKQGMIEFYFHFRKFIIGCGESRSKETRQEAIKEFANEAMGPDLRQVSGNERRREMESSPLCP